MLGFEDLKAKVKEIFDLLEGKATGRGSAKTPKPDLLIPESEIPRLVSELDRTLETLKGYLRKVPTKEDLAVALKHPLAEKIVDFTLDTKLKALFSPAYFRTKFDSLPKGKEDFLRVMGKKTAYREALILYHWWHGRRDNFQGLESLWHDIESDFSKKPPAKDDLASALRHPLANQIAVFTNLDKKRKAFFSPAYFQDKFSSLPRGKEDFLTATGKKTAYREALILYHWWHTRLANFKGLEALWHDIESDYKNSPSIVRESAARSFLEELMGVSDVSDTARRLAERYPSATDLKDFATLVGLKIPPQPRGRGVAKLTPHERLAHEIHRQGGVTRLDLD